MHGIDSVCPSLRSQYIACRLCSKVFTSTRSLVNHIESHIIQEDSFSTTRGGWGVPPIRRDSIPNPHLSAFPPLTSRAPIHGGFLPSASLGRNLSSVNGSHVVVPQSNPPQCILLPINSGNHAVSARDESPSGVTRPYILQLEHPISAMIRPREFDGEMDSTMIDLTLKL